jgi:hypothetical protein
MSELSLPSNCSMNFPDGKEKLMHFEITIRPEEGYYRWGPAVLEELAACGSRMSLSPAVGISNHTV